MLLESWNILIFLTFSSISFLKHENFNNTTYEQTLVFGIYVEEYDVSNYILINLDTKSIYFISLIKYFIIVVRTF